MFWIYKCNSTRHPRQRTWGDWNDVFGTMESQWWGTTRVVPELANASVGDTVLAYQTNRNELVGLARVVGWRRERGGKRLVVRPTHRLGVRIRPLKKSNRSINRIPALQPGPIKTLYAISSSDAQLLLKAARRTLKKESSLSDADAEGAVKGAGFGKPETNRLVEKAAMDHVRKYFSDLGWVVKDVSRENRGYDFLCHRKGVERHIEVKGASGTGQQFIITAKEFKTWKKDGRFTLAFVAAAHTSEPSLVVFPGIRSTREFEFRPLAYVARRSPKTSGATAK